jgi:hypothetical protein
VVVHAVHLQPLHLVEIVHLSLRRCQAPANTGQTPHMGCFLLVRLVDTLGSRKQVIGSRVRNKYRFPLDSNPTQPQPAPLLQSEKSKRTKCTRLFKNHNPFKLGLEKRD